MTAFANNRRARSRSPARRCPRVGCASARGQNRARAMRDDVTQAILPNLRICWSDSLQSGALIALIGALAAAYPAAARGQQSGRYLRALQAAKRDYEKMSKSSEAARTDYITRLVRMREKAARLKTDEWQAIDAEIKRHPAPSDSDGKKLSSLLVGEWESPRHDYLFRPDGTWTMLPIEEGITHGR